MSNIVSEIQVAVKDLLPAYTGYSQLNYEYAVDLNSENLNDEKFGFIPEGASFVSGGSMGFTTMDHTFQLILTKDFNNRDCDTAQNTALMDLYGKAQGVLVELQKSRLQLPTPTNRVLLIYGLSFEDPEFSSDNSTVALRANFNIQYSYRNN